MGLSIVTGSKGFIASHLYEYLKDKQGPIACYDIRGDLTQDVTVLSGIPKCETLYHLAAMTSVSDCEEDPGNALNVNVNGTANVLYLANKAGYKSIVFASSAAVYGDQDVPCDEQMDPKPLGVYGASKVFGEALVDTLSNACSLRLFNVYGPGCKGVISTYVDAALKGEPLYIEGDGMQVRDFVHVSDVVKAMKLASDKGVEGTYNIGTGKVINIGNLARWVVKQTGSQSKIKFRDKRAGDIRSSICDSTKAKKKFGWEPQVQLEQGLKDYIQWKMSSSSEQAK